MTREKQRQAKMLAKATKALQKMEAKQEKNEIKSWGKMVRIAKEKGAWIEETDSHFIIKTPKS